MFKKIKKIFAYYHLGKHVIKNELVVIEFNQFKQISQSFGRTLSELQLRKMYNSLKKSYDNFK